MVLQLNNNDERSHNIGQNKTYIENSWQLGIGKCPRSDPPFNIPRTITAREVHFALSAIVLPHPQLAGHIYNSVLDYCLLAGLLSLFAKRRGVVHPVVVV